MKKYFLTAFLLGFIGKGMAQDENAAPGQSLEDKIQNPIANMVNVPIQYNYITGANGGNSSLLNIQPVIPFVLSKDYLLISRTIVPILDVPNSGLGVGNIIITTAITPSNQGSFTWGVGPAIMFPTVSEGYGYNKLSIGPSIGALNQVNGWTYGGFIQNFFSVAGPSDTGKVSYLYLQVAGAKKLKNGYYINCAPNITCDWNAPKGRQWTVPMGFGFGKLIKKNFMHIPLNAQIGAYKYLEHPQDADWLFRAQLTMIFLDKKK